MPTTNSRLRLMSAWWVAAMSGCLFIACAHNDDAEAPSAGAAQQQDLVTVSARAALPKSLAGPSCDECRAKWCSNDDGAADGVDFLRGCYEKPDSKYAPDADPHFTRDCIAAVECAYKNKCGFDPALGPVECFCGSNRVDECKNVGPAADAKCVAEWKAATRGTTTMDVLRRFTQIEYPSAWAFHLIECDRDRCGAKSAWGRCVP